MSDSREQRLADFVSWTTQHISGDEKGEAQIFLEHLFQAFGQRGTKEAGATLEHRVKNTKGGTSFADLVWKPKVLIEMKKRGANLPEHLQQAFDYWTQLVPGRPRYVVLCNFDEFRIYDFDVDISQPLDIVTLADLPHRYKALAFLFPTDEKPQFRIDREKVTREAADFLAATYNSLISRQIPPDTAQRFILQILVALFSEDIGFLPKGFVTELIDECTSPPKAFDLLDGLFRAMNTPDNKSGRGGRFKDVPYFNGGLFQSSAAIELDPHLEVTKLRLACERDWSHVSPDIFGTLFQHSLNKEDRHAFGAHYTSPTDIMKIVKPTIVDPFRERIASAKSLKELASIRNTLTSLRVLDPACGSGNFLYIAYREMRRLEVAINDRQNELDPKAGRGQMSLGGVSPRQFFGLDILPFAVELAKVTLAIAPKLASDELHTSEKTLPLANLDQNILRQDALLDDLNNPAPWPPADVIIGNPPFLGAKRLKPEHGPDYINKLRAVYPDVPGMADYCVYWFRRAHDHLPIATPQNPHAGRAGLVGTQNIRNNQSRVGGLDHIVKSAIIVDAVENQPWSGEANVHVSIANWVKFADANPGYHMDTSKLPPFMPDVFPFPGKSALEIRLNEARKLLAGMPPPGAIGTLAQQRALARDFLAAYEKAQSQPPAPSLPKSAEPTLLIPTPRILWSKASSPKSSIKLKTKGTRADKTFELVARGTASITSTLSDQTDVAEAVPLRCNQSPSIALRGFEPGNMQFLVSAQQANEWIKRQANCAEVVNPYLTGDDIVTESGSPQRYIIDFRRMSVTDAMQYREPFEHVQKYVLAEMSQIDGVKGSEDVSPEFKARIKSRKLVARLENWWQLRRSVPETRQALSAIHRYVVSPLVTKRPIFVFMHSTVMPNNKTQPFMLEDDYSFGLLQSDPHWEWFKTKCAKLTERFSYSPTVVFDTFPWPQSPTKPQVKAVAAAAVHLRKIRTDALKNMEGGLRALYRTLELPGKSPLKDAHADLDAAVLDAYGFSPKKDLLQQLLDLNHQVAAAEKATQPVTPPGIPPSFPQKDRPSLITPDCIQP